jgi:hypothetical protein
MLVVVIRVLTGMMSTQGERKVIAKKTISIGIAKLRLHVDAINCLVKVRDDTFSVTTGRICDNFGGVIH